MEPRPASELIQSLRLTLQKIEENFASVEDEPNIAELKRILLLRIADIEATEALREAEASAIPNDTVPKAEAVAMQQSVIEQVAEGNSTVLDQSKPLIIES
jgi:hypothetical protein